MNEPVFGLLRSKPVEIDRMFESRCRELCALFRLGVAGVEKAGAILRPSDIREACPLDLITEDCAAIDFKNANRAPIRSTLLGCIGKIGRIFRRRPFSQSGGTISRPFVR